MTFSFARGCLVKGWINQAIGRWPFAVCDLRARGTGFKYLSMAIWLAATCVMLAPVWEAQAFPGQAIQNQQMSSGLAESFFPKKVWFHPREECAWPATPNHPGLASYRIRQHPEDPSMLTITYSLLYKTDCGGFLGIDSHPGDVEGFSLTLEQDQTCPQGWRLFSARSTAHGGAPRDVDNVIVNTCEPLPELFVSRSKHGTYLSMKQCNAYIDPTQRCQRGFTTDFVLIDAGSPEAPLADDLSGYFPSEPCDPPLPSESIWSGDGRFCGGQCVENRSEDCVAAPGFKLTDDSMLAAPRREGTALVAFGDSMTHGTMDATNNSLNTLNAYVQKVRQSLEKELPILLRHPLFDFEQERMWPARIPSNLAVDGSEIFSIEGLEYYKRAGTIESNPSRDLMVDKLLPMNLSDKYDKVLYPINLMTWKLAISALDSGIWLIDEGLPAAGIDQAITLFWSGNNESSVAALGAGGKNPTFQPLPLEQMKTELKPLVSWLLEFGEKNGVVSFEPYTQASIERNLTDLQDFEIQYNHVIEKLLSDTAAGGVNNPVFLITLPYYSAVGYLMDSEDLEFYLKKVDPSYSVPGTFKRVTPPGVPISDYLKGDRISLLTFGMMYTLLSTGHSTAQVNQVLEIDGQQRDGLVLSEQEQQFIMSRIDDYNRVIMDQADIWGGNVHVLGVGQFLNKALTGETIVEVDGRRLTRKWVRGNAFSLDGVHPGYTGHGIVANYIIEKLNSILGIDAPLQDLSDIMGTDPYVDWDGDGWAAGPAYTPKGLAQLLFLFTDPDDGDAHVQPEMPANVWELISDILLDQIIDIPAVKAEAERRRLVP